MNSYIFLTTEGYTFQPNSESPLPDTENLQVLGFSEGNDEKEAFDNLIRENPHLLETAFNETICLEIKGSIVEGHHFYISEKMGEK